MDLTKNNDRPDFSSLWGGRELLLPGDEDGGFWFFAPLLFLCNCCREIKKQALIGRISAQSFGHKKAPQTAVQERSFGWLSFAAGLVKGFFFNAGLPCHGFYDVLSEWGDVFRNCYLVEMAVFYLAPLFVPGCAFGLEFEAELFKALYHITIV